MERASEAYRQPLVACVPVLTVLLCLFPGTPGLGGIDASPSATSLSTPQAVATPGGGFGAPNGYSDAPGATGVCVRGLLGSAA
jgi:hypothetical protein